MVRKDASNRLKDYLYTNGEHDMRFGKPRKNQKRINPRYHLNETAKIENNSSKNMHDVQFYLEEFYPFAKEALGFDQDASIVFESDFSNAKNPLGKTAHYDPSNSTVTVYVDKRHPKDVMRSVSHELVHHAQNVRGDLQGASMEEGYAQTDGHLREMEKEAYTKGNMLFRDWTDSRSNPDGQKDIMARIMQEWGYDETALTEEGGGFEEGQLVKVVSSALAIDGEKNGTVVSYEDPAVTIKLDDDQEGKYVPDDKMVKVKKDFVEPRAEAGFDDVMGESMGGYSWSQNNDGVLELKDDRGMVWGSVERAAGSRSTWNVYDDEGEEPIAIAYDLESAKSELLDLLDIADEAINEMYDDDFGDDDLDMAALEKEFPWLAKDVKTREAPPEVAADLADEFGDKGEPEEEEEPVVMKEDAEGLFVAEDGVNSTKPLPSEDDAYDAFVDKYDDEPLRIVDVTDGHDNARIVWDSELDEGRPGRPVVMKEAEFVGHHAEIDGETYVDSNFLNSVRKVRDTFPHELKHMGGGDFYLETPKGKVQFSRSRGQSVHGTVPSFVGRAHQLYGEPPELADELMAAMEAAGASEVASTEGVGGSDSEGYSKMSGTRPLEEGGKDWAAFGAEDAKKGLPPSPPKTGRDVIGWYEYMEAYKAVAGTTVGGSTGSHMKEKLSDEEEKEMTDKMSNKEFVKYATHDKHVRPSIDRERYTEIPGLEGPFQYDSGAVLYYDPKAGKYWDRDKDQYLDHEEAAELTMETADVNEEAVLNLEMFDTGSAEGDEAGNCEAKGGKWDPAQRKCVYEEENINNKGDNEMNIEEIVRSAVRRALREKKYRREDEEEKEEKNESFAAMLSKQTDKINKKSRDSAETLKKLKTKDDGTYDYDQDEEKTEEAVTEGATNEEFDKLDAIVAAMGAEQAVESLVQALPSHVAHEMLDYIGQMHEIPFDGEMDDMEEKLSAGQEELDLDDDGKIEPSDLAGLRSGKTDDEVGEEAEESLKETAGPDPIDFANEHDLDYQTDNEGNVVIYMTQEQGEDLWLPNDAQGWQVEKTNEGGYVIYTNTPYKRMEEDVATPVALKGPFDPSQVQSVEDPEYGGMIHTLPNVELTGDLEQDVYDMIGGDEELYSWLWGEMESGDSITDAAGRHVYSGSDVQDHIKAHEESGPGGSHHYQENKSDKEWYDSKLFESLMKKWAK